MICAFVLGRKPSVQRSACASMQAARHRCVVVAHGTPCLGPVTHAGCGAICPATTAAAMAASARWRRPNAAALARGCGELGATETAIDRLFHTFNAAPSRSRKRGRAWRLSGAPRRSARTLARVEGEGAMHVRIEDGQRHRGRARHLRAAALLRGVPARPRLHRGPRHHRAHLRHLPGRLPDERGHGDGERCAASRSAASCAALRRLLYCGEWIESHALHIFMLHAPDFLGYAGRRRDGARPPGDRRATRCAEEGRQRGDARRRRARGAPDQRARRRLLPRAAQGRARDARRAARAGARDRARRR